MCGIRQIVAMLATVLALAAGAARAENVVRWASTAEALSFDPHSANHQPTWAQNAQVYEPLVDYNSQNEIQPALAVAWKVADGRSWEFVLRDGVRFHDGTPLGPADVVFSLQRSKAESSDFKSDLPPISEVRAVDERTVRITTEAFDPLLPNRLSQIFIMPRGWAERHGALAPAPYDDAEASFVERHANGTGPFILERFEPGVATVMRRNADWWGLTQYPHNIDGIVHTQIVEPERRLAALLGGEIDLLQDAPLASLEQIDASPVLVVRQGTEFRTIFFGLDQGRSKLRSSSVKGVNPFADRRVRRAVYQAIDIETIRRDVMHGFSIPAGIIIQPGINGYTAELDRRLPYDPGAAKALLADAGYPSGFDVQIDCPKDRYVNDAAICRAVVGMLGQIGIAVRLAAEPMRQHLPKIADRITDFYMLGWGSGTYDSYYHLSMLVQSGGTYNATGYANPKIDALMRAIDRESVTYARDAMLEEVWRQVLDDIVYVPLHHQVLVWAMRRELDLPVDPNDVPRFRLARWLSAPRK